MGDDDVACVECFSINRLIDVLEVDKTAAAPSVGEHAILSSADAFEHDS